MRFVIAHWVFVWITTEMTEKYRRAICANREIGNLKNSPRTPSALPCASNNACPAACHYLQLHHDDELLMTDMIFVKFFYTSTFSNF